MNAPTANDIARMIDHTNLKADATREDLERLCREAKEYGFASVCVNSGYAGFASDLLEGTDVAVCVTVGFPLGASSIISKVQETMDACIHGATEVDYVVNVTEVKAGNWDYVRDEMAEIVNIAREHDAIVKVIFENCYLTDEQKTKLCEIAAEVKPAFVKTSTGFSTGGATADDVRLMRANVPEYVKVKAAGGIRTADDLLLFLECGADRFGCSAGIPIMEELRARGM